MHFSSAMCDHHNAPGNMLVVLLSTAMAKQLRSKTHGSFFKIREFLVWSTS